MSLPPIDTAAVARALAQVADRPDDLAEVYFERREDVELAAEDDGPGLRVRRESGLAARLVRDAQSWTATRDTIAPAALRAALRQVARAVPRVRYPDPQLGEDRWSEPPEAAELQELPAAVTRRLRAQQGEVPHRLTVRRHRRWTQVVGPRVASPVERESFYSVEAEGPWGRWGGLFPTVGEAQAEAIADSLIRAWRARDAPPPRPSRGVTILGPAATAVFLHEAVAHALECDTLAVGGRPEAAVGLRLGPETVHVIDDPQTAPEPLRRTTDDEGNPVLRRWLLRGGVVEQPLADALYARHSELLAAGAGRRGSRHDPPGPRSTHLELLPGEAPPERLLAEAEGGLYLAEASRGRLDPASGEFSLRFPWARRITNRVAGPLTGPCTLHGRLKDVLAGVDGIGSELHTAGGGWCAKGGVRLAVWGTVPHLRLDGVEVGP